MEDSRSPHRQHDLQVLLDAAGQALAGEGELPYALRFRAVEATR